MSPEETTLLYILSTLAQFRGHRIKTASALGIGVRTLGMKLKKWREEGDTSELTAPAHVAHELR